MLQQVMQFPVAPEWRFMRKMLVTTAHHKVEDGHRKAREERRCDLASHQRNGQSLEDVEKATDCSVQAFVSTSSEINSAINRYYETR